MSDIPAPPPPPIGHNSLNANQLRSIVERIERLAEERKALGGDISDIFKEAKSAGFDPKVIRLVLRDRAQNRDELEEIEQLRGLYHQNLGTP